MKSRLVLFLLAVAVLASGCTHRRVLELGASPAGYRVANQATAWLDAEVLTRDGQVFRWYDVRFTPDSIWGVVLGSGAAQRPAAVPTQQVIEVTVRSRSQGAFDGAAIGAGIGVVLGFIVGPDDESCVAPCASTRPEQALILGVVGAVWGVIIRAIRASRTKVQVRCARSCACELRRVGPGLCRRPRLVGPGVRPDWRVSEDHRVGGRWAG